MRLRCYLYLLYLCMDALIVYPENKDQLTALKAVMKAMKISFDEQRSQQYPQYVIDGVLESLKQVEAGQVKPFTGVNDMLKRR